ncbi:MAG: DUF488 family protein [Candidatus Eremiobacteraeota bacterium]|nr:DUF488 family protein [Candidatus Eremiobacteraeota bacterium]
MIEIRLKRAYEEPARSDGPRLLVDRLWPRGIAKKDAKLSDWLKEVAPSEELRVWYDHDPEKWDEFRKRYGWELDANKTEDFRKLKNHIRDQKRITLVYGAKDEVHNNAVALKDFLQREK